MGDEIQKIVLIISSIFALPVNTVLLAAQLQQKTNHKRNHRYITHLLTAFRIVSSPLILLTVCLPQLKMVGSEYCCNLLQKTMVLVYTQLPMGFFICYALERFYHVESTLEIITRWRIFVCLSAHACVGMVIGIFIYLLEMSCCRVSVGVNSTDIFVEHIYPINYCSKCCDYLSLVCFHLFPLLVTCLLCRRTINILSQQEEQSRNFGSAISAKYMRIVGNRKILRKIVAKTIFFAASTIPWSVLLLFDTMDIEHRTVNTELTTTMMFALYLAASPLIDATMDRNMRRKVNLFFFPMQKQLETYEGRFLSKLKRVLSKIL